MVDMNNDGNKGSMATAAQGSKPIFVRNPGSNDIVLGCGAPILKLEGNVRFRELVKTSKTEYLGTSGHTIKHDIEMQIVAVIESRDGRFLRKVERVADAPTLYGTTLYQVVELGVALEKVKQSLRDKDVVKPDIVLTGITSGSSALLHGKLSQSSAERTVETVADLNLSESHTAVNDIMFQTTSWDLYVALLLAQARNSKQTAILHHHRLAQQYRELLRQRDFI